MENIDRLKILNQQTKLKSGYESLKNIVREPLYTKKIQEFKNPYQTTHQLDFNNGLSLFQNNTQDLKYDKIICGRQLREEKTRFNYAIDNHITNKLVNVSGLMYKNSDLRVQPNRIIAQSTNYTKPIGI